MSSNPSTTLAQDLLEHESFVCAMVRGILADDHAVQDLLQETWLRALRRSPRSPQSMRPWLASVARNLARSTRRSEQRRELREREGARTEALESAESAAERVALRREVADAVLALEEPYRAVVLMRYEQGLEPGAIAARLGRSPATVRSQLSRAHAKLRERLDERVEGGTRAWGTVLLAWRPGGSIGTAPPTLVLSAVAGGGLALAGLGFALRGSRSAERESVALEMPGPLSIASSEASPAAEARTASSRAPAAAVPEPATDPEQSSRVGGPALGARDVESLRTLAWQVQRELEAKLLAVDPELLAEHAELVGREDSGVARLLSGRGLGELSNVTWSDGGGCYFSFATGSHDYQREPCLSFSDARFSSVFYGGHAAFMLALGELPIEEVPDDGSRVPDGLPPQRERDWRALWSDLDFGQPLGPELRDLELAAKGVLPAPAIGATYALRSHSDGEHDLIAAFQVLALDERSCTIAWRVLRRFPLPGKYAGAKAERAIPPPSPAWLSKRDVDGLLDLLREIRSVGCEKLFEVPAAERASFKRIVRHPSTNSADRAGVARILHRWEWGALVEQREGGACFSFFSGSNDFGLDPDLGLEQRTFSSSFAGTRGLLLDLGEVPAVELAGLYEGKPPASLQARRRETWDWMRDLRPYFDLELGRRTLPAADLTRIEELDMRRGVPALAGHTYLLRTALYESHDHLVVFTVIGEDVAGLTLAWRVIESYPIVR